MLIEPQNISFTTSAVLFQSGSEKVAASPQKVPKMSHSVPHQSNTTGFPGLRTSLLLSSVSLSSHKLALSTANWYQWSLNGEGTVPRDSVQRDQLISIKIMGGKNILAHRNVLHASLIIYRKFLFHLPCIEHFLSCFICKYVCMYVFVYLLAYFCLI